MKKLYHFKLDAEEREILEKFEKSELQDAQNMRAEVMRISKILDAAGRKTKNINIRLGEADVLRIKLIASENGLPYQTLIAAILRQYVNGKIRVQI